MTLNTLKYRHNGGQIVVEMMEVLTIRIKNHVEITKKNGKHHLYKITNKELAQILQLLSKSREEN